VTSVYGRQIRLRIRDASGLRRGKLPGADGAALWSFGRPSAPTAEQIWKGEGNVTKGEIIVVFPKALAPGTKVWFTAYWYNRAALSGPACTPVWSTIGFDDAEPLAA
jgi:hypothetical protein